MGGTELLKNKLLRDCDPELLKHFQISNPLNTLTDETKENKILWFHDTPKTTHSNILLSGEWKKYDKLVFVSYWQQEMFNIFCKIPFSQGMVIRNAIEPIINHSKPDDDIIRLIYTSTPHRGLYILYTVFKKLSEEFNNIELDVYSSFSLYNKPELDKKFTNLFSKLDAHPKINNHKTKSNDEIRDALTRADIFVYPSIWQETSCLCLIEAMSARCVSVHSSLAALPETSMGLTNMYAYEENLNVHAEKFYQALKNSILTLHDDKTKVRLKNIKTIIDVSHNWNTQKGEWNKLMKDILNKKS